MWMVSLLLAGCGPDYALGDVPLHGGTEEQRLTVRLELLRLEDWIGDDVRLRAVAFDHLGRHAGRYSRATRKVLIDQQLPLFELPEVTRHEVGHAVGHQRDLDDARDYEDAFHLLSEFPKGYPERRRNSEGLALLLETTPFRLATQCGASAVTEHRTFLLQEAWTQAVGGTVERVVVGERPVTSSGIDEVEVYDDRYVVVHLSSSPQVHTLDLDDGSWVGEPPSTAVPASRGRGPSFPDQRAGRAETVSGPGVVAGRYLEPVPSGPLVSYDGEPWRWAVPSCLGTDETLFVADGWAGSAWVEGRQLHVALLEPVDGSLAMVGW